MNAFVVYKITNLKNKLFYIGSTSNFHARKAEHLGQLRKGKHCNKQLQFDFKVFGEKAFSIEILEDSFKSRQQMLMREYTLILKTFKQNYNVDAICPILDINGKHGVDHKQFKKPFVVPPNPKKADRALQKERNKKQQQNKMTHPELDRIAERKAMRDKFRGNDDDQDFLIIQQP